MKAVLSDLYKSLRGKLGTTAVNYPYGGRNFVRGYVVPTNPKTAMQDAIRALFAQVSVAFSNIDGTERAGWDTINANHLKTDKDGKPYKAGAKGWYTAINALRKLAGQAIVDTAPAWAYENGPYDIASVTVGTNLVIDFTGIAQGKKYLVKMSDALPGTQRKPRSFVLVSTTTAENFVTAGAGGVSQLEVAAADLAKSWKSGDRVVVLIQGISDGYIPGGMFAKELTITAN